MNTSNANFFYRFQELESDEITIVEKIIFKGDETDKLVSRLNKNKKKASNIYQIEKFENEIDGSGDPYEYEFAFNDNDLENIFNKTKRKVSFLGHTIAYI